MTERVNGSAEKCSLCGVAAVGTMMELGSGSKVHELCFLQDRNGRITRILCGILHRLGGLARIHESDIERGLELLQQANLRTREEPGGWVVVVVGEEKLITPATTLPRPPGKV